jgi:hypothetical protein
MTARPVYGRVYEVVLRGQPEAQHSYVGKTTQTIHQRVHGSSGHTCAADVARDPWKAGILPGRAGYRLLETVYDTGDPAENARALARAESFWIDRLRPLHNDVRPVRPIGEVRTAVRRQPRPSRTIVRATRRRRRKFGKPIALLALVALFTFLAAWFVVAMQLPWPQAPWISSPVIGLALGWTVFWRIHRSVRRILR